MFPGCSGCHCWMSSDFLDFVSCFRVIASHKLKLCNANLHLAHIACVVYVDMIESELLLTFFFVEKFKSVESSSLEKGRKRRRENVQLLLGAPIGAPII